MRSRVSYTLCRKLPQGTVFYMHDYTIMENGRYVGDVDTLLVNDSAKIHYLVERKRNVHKDSGGDIVAQLKRTRDAYERQVVFKAPQRLFLCKRAVLRGRQLRGSGGSATIRSPCSVGQYGAAGPLPASGYQRSGESPILLSSPK